MRFSIVIAALVAGTIASPVAMPQRGGDNGLRFGDAGNDNDIDNDAPQIDGNNAVDAPAADVDAANPEENVDADAPVDAPAAEADVEAPAEDADAGAAQDDAAQDDAATDAPAGNGAVDPALVPDFGVEAGVNPDGQGSCEGLNGVLIPCVCPPERGAFIAKLEEFVAAGNALGVPVSFPADDSAESQRTRIQTAIVTLQNFNGSPGSGCPAAATTFVAQRDAI